MLFSKYGVEEYVADGVIVLHYLGIGTESNRSIFVRKMRGLITLKIYCPWR